MRKSKFHFKNVTGTFPNIYSGLEKPEGFRIPSIYFSFGALESDRGRHYHPDNDELLYVLSGTGRIGLYGPSYPDKPFEEHYDVSAGDIVLFPQGWSHDLKDTSGPEDSIKVLVVFNHSDFTAIEIPDSDTGAE